MLYTSNHLDIEAYVEYKESGERLNEHRNEQKRDEKTDLPDALCESYLEIEEGKTFRVHVKLRRVHHSLRQPVLTAFLHIDGRCITGVYLGLTSPTRTLDHMIIHEGGRYLQADLSFAQLPKTDEPSEVEVSGDATKNLCRMEIVIQRGTKGASVPFNPKAIKAIGKCHEKALKLGSTVVAADPKTYVRGESTAFIPDRFRPDVARFVWMYHTKPKLIVMGIIEDDAPAEEPVVPPRRKRRYSNGQGDRGGRADTGKTQSGEDIDIVKRVKREPLGNLGSQQKPIIVDQNGSGRRVSGKGTRARPLVLDD